MLTRNHIIKNLSIGQLALSEQDRIIDLYLEYVIYRMIDQIIVEKEGHPDDLLFEHLDQYLRLYIRLFGKEKFNSQLLIWNQEFIKSCNKNGK